MSREHRQAYMEGFGRAMLLEDYAEEDFGDDDFGAAAPNSINEDIVPHLCETQWDESDARCIQHLGDPTFGWVYGPNWQD